jgi:hypothetical protein
MIKVKVSFKGIVKGAFSKYQSWGLEESPVMKFEGSTLHSVLKGLAIEEWTFILTVDGRRIQDVAGYIKSKRLKIENYMRTECAV